MSIAHWPVAERPREKLLERGASVLSDAELLAIFLRTGIRGHSAVDLGRDLIRRFGSLSGLLCAQEQDVTALPGLGPSKVAQLLAVRELAHRALREEMAATNILDSPERVSDYLRLLMGGHEVEVFMVIFLSVRNHILTAQELFRGTLTETRVYPREIVRLALRHNAAALILAHNHPSGEPEPSMPDLLVTEALQRLLREVDIRLLDHVIVTRQQTVSLAARGYC
ncbi:RadC family protein [Paludibacterium purpuratum]|uniref:DNA replication and repair protein RadC n=1 Tax=Paludibacterium purpuratum TaxID=1144873 RepID=A0A4R7AW20_9NEIS|nr:DNA repair protein RadC [Paludibacterium purpuratum]TDR71432.1 DNA replication and repair protein RadC [Paludibacterium purpuratum]